MDGVADVTFGEALVQELLWIHDVIRRDLAIVRELAASVMDGAPAGDVQDRIAALEANGPLWQLKFGCLHYCRHVHGHHTFEDQAWFPGLRAANPELGPTVDRLESDHVEVAGQLHEIERCAGALDETTETRMQLRTALEALAVTLVAHLDFEEAALSPTLRTLTVPPWMVQPRG